MPEVDTSNDKAMDKDDGNVEIDEDGNEGIVQVQDDDTYDYVRDQETSRYEDSHPKQTPCVNPKPSTCSTLPMVCHIQIYLV